MVGNGQIELALDANVTEHVRLRNAGFLKKGSAAVEAGKQVMDKALPAHVMDDLARRVIRAFRFAVFDFQQVFKDLPQHFRIDGYFFFKRFVFFDGKVIAVKNIQNAVAFIAFFGFPVIGK